MVPGSDQRLHEHRPDADLSGRRDPHHRIRQHGSDDRGHHRHGGAPGQNVRAGQFLAEHPGRYDPFDGAFRPNFEYFDRPVEIDNDPEADQA